MRNRTLDALAAHLLVPASRALRRVSRLLETLAYVLDPEGTQGAQEEPPRSTPAPPCAACGIRAAEFCDLCAECERVQHSMGGEWDGESLTSLKSRLAGDGAPVTVSPEADRMVAKPSPKGEPSSTAPLAGSLRDRMRSN